MLQYTISNATNADLTDIVAIYNSSISSGQSTADLKPVTVEERQAWFDAHSSKRPIYVLKDINHALLAWGSFSDYYPRPAYHISAEISIYVRQDMRGVGVGRILVRYMMECAPALGIENIIAVIFGHNHASIGLFSALGFQQWGRLPNVCALPSRHADIILLGKPLRP